MQLLMLTRAIFAFHYRIVCQFDFVRIYTYIFPFLQNLATAQHLENDKLCN